MEAERLTIEDLDNTDNMAAPTAVVIPQPSPITTSTGVIPKDLYTESSNQPKLSASTGNINFRNNGSNNEDSTFQFVGPGGLRKVSLSSSAAALIGSESMPKIDLNASSQSMNKNIKNLVQEEIDLRPGQRPPTPARPSLPTLLPNKLQDLPLNCSITSTRSEGIRNISQIRRVTLSSLPRSSSEPHQLPTSPRISSSDEENIDILDSSTKSEGWDQLWGGRLSRAPSQMQHNHIEGHVVPLPPICLSKHIEPGQRSKLIENNRNKEDSVLNVAKKTLEKLETVLAPEVKAGRIPRARTHNQLHLTS